MKQRRAPETAAVLIFATIAAATHAAPQNDDAGSQSDQLSKIDLETQLQDAWLDGKLDAVLLFNEHLDARLIDTDVKDGVAYLWGTVDVDIKRDLAGEIAQSIDGIQEVRNDIEVDPERAKRAAESRPEQPLEGFRESVVNATLTARVKTELLANNNTHGMAINVDSKDGLVTLSGEVESSAEKELAGRIASNVNGTESVSNQLVVLPREGGE